MALNKKPFFALYDYLDNVEERILSRGKNAAKEYNVQYSVWSDELDNTFIYSEIRGSMNQMLGNADITYIFSDFFKNGDYAKASEYAQNHFKELSDDTGIKCEYVTRSAPPLGIKVNDDSLRFNAELNFKSKLQNCLSSVKSGYGIISVLHNTSVHGDNTNTSVKIYVNQNINGEHKKGGILAEMTLFYPGKETDVREMAKSAIENLRETKNLADNVIISVSPQKKKPLTYGDAENYLENLTLRLENQLNGRKKIDNVRFKIHNTSDRFAVSFLEGNIIKFSCGYSYDNYKPHGNNDVSTQQTYLRLSAIDIAEKAANKFSQALVIDDLIIKEKVEKGDTVKTLKEILSNDTLQAIESSNEQLNKTTDNKQKQTPKPIISFSAKELAVIDREKVANHLKQHNDFFKFALAIDKAVSDFIDGKGEKTQLNLTNSRNSIKFETIIDGQKQAEKVNKDIPAEYFEKYLKDEVARAEGGEYLSHKVINLDPVNPINSDNVKDKIYEELCNTYSSAKKLFTKNNVTDFAELSQAIDSPEKITKGAETIR